ncbi:hypothetical protein [Vibrio sp. 16]|uniref:hypothetical protein n=1 Tax=Vibrio sp. 16 TaxID=391586 RepID=UPI000305FDB4|nr:hypothetical protein [Vibrio sp. 16]CAK4070793.1 hypothetical protein VDT1_2666 [Vibrio sp. 16]
MNEQLFDRIRQIIGEGSSVNKVERLAQYVLSQGSGGHLGILAQTIKPTLDLRPVRYPQQAYADYIRKDCFSIVDQNGQTVTVSDFVPQAMRDSILEDIDGHQNKELEFTLSINIRYQIGLNADGFSDVNLWDGLALDIGFDIDKTPEIVEPLVRIPVNVNRDSHDVLVLTANYTKVARLPLGPTEGNNTGLTAEALNFTFNNLHLACQLVWEYTEIPWEEYSEKILWTENVIELNPLSMYVSYAEPFSISVLDVNIVDKVDNNVVPV